jgi:hypothetical protein
MNMNAVSPSMDEVTGASNRSFGFVFAAVFALIAFLPLWRGAEPRYWAAGLSLLLIVMSLVRPALLAPANRAWFVVGLVLHRITNPILMAVVFFIGVTPFALVTRVVNPRFARRMRPDASASTYWISRDSGVSPMDQQF